MMEPDEAFVGEVVLTVQGEHFELPMSLPAKPVKPPRMLPVFQRLTDSFVARSVELSEAAGKAISCSAGCGACCRQPVLISEAEAYNLTDLVESMPEPRRSAIKKRFADACSHFSNLKWFERYTNFVSDLRGKENEALGEEFVGLLSQYVGQRIPCPFLENESCSIYEDRPLICREYLVTSPLENCANPTPKNIEKMPIAVHASRALGVLSKTSNPREPASLLLIRALEFADKFPEKFDERPGPEWADDFFRLITGKQHPNDYT